MNRVQFKWLLIALLWLGALGLFFYNGQSSEDLSKYLSDVKTINAYRGFLDHSRVQMVSAEKEFATLYQPIDSLDFGVLFLEEDLFRQAKACELRGFHFEAADKVGAKDRLAIKLKVQGSVKSLIRMVHTLESEYPYISLASIETAKDGADFGTFVISLTYYFKLVAA